MCIYKKCTCMPYKMHLYRWYTVCMGDASYYVARIYCIKKIYCIKYIICHNIN